ncbi:sporulation killing factor system integral membrane protein [Paenibacillus sp. 481]|uniref:sporulation killing factor system integral membrane protein n=1 Tax=Paenibacillus sp. 481 TaxID=2835869 RepID=UPI001E52A884|nr:sporulation killing factor system integral membrane protein [Paenibacillus sp. 481]UHA71982.1 sporulation killing factor system integral membrane protein [Paenibacillus sp. 481]
MGDIWQLYRLQLFRSLSNQERKTKIPFLLLVTLALFVTLQLNIGDAGNEESLVYFGWGLAVMFLIYTVLGIGSNRLPSKMEDVIWLYSMPLHLSRIAHATVLWQVFLRSSLWLLGAVIGDIIRLSISMSYVNLTGKALLTLVVIGAMEYWLVALSCARMNRGIRIVFGLGALIFTVLLGFASYYTFFVPESPYVWNMVADVISEFGLIFKGSYSWKTGTTVFILICLSFALIHYSTRSLKCKEQLVREADFWSEFKDYNAFSASIQPQQFKSWWGAQFLTGLGSFLWFEINIAKKNVFTHLFQLLFIIAIVYYVIVYRFDWIIIVNVVLVAAILMNSYFSGLVRHMQSGDLFLLPGKFYLKVLVLELAHMMWIFIPISVFIGFGWSNERLNMEQVGVAIGYAIGLFVLLLGIRLTAAMQTYGRQEGLPIMIYFKNVLYVVVGSTALVGFFANILPLLLASPYVLPLVMILIGLSLWMVSIRNQGRAYFIHFYALISIGAFLLSRL